MRFRLAERHIVSECYAAKGPALKRVCGPFIPGQLGEGWQARGFHLCDLIQASMRSRLGSSSSQWPALRSAARRSPTTCSSVIRESSCIGYIQLATCAPVDPCLFLIPHTERHSGWAGTHIAESLINGTQCVCVSATWFLASQYLLAHLCPSSGSCGA
jgi:hypothetical protein